jgi:hypothetical protein
VSARSAFAAGFAAVVALLLVPALDNPLRRLAASDADGPDPQYDVRLDDEGLRRAAEQLPDDATYLIQAPGASPLLQGNLKAAAHLLFTPSIGVHDRALADYALVYTDRARLERLKK